MVRPHYLPPFSNLRGCGEIEYAPELRSGVRKYVGVQIPSAPPSPIGEISRHAWLRTRCRKKRTGASPVSGTKAPWRNSRRACFKNMYPHGCESANLSGATKIY